jgi:hypothetical protein
MMSQSTIVFFFLVFAYLIYITQRGELPAYLALLYGGGTPAPSPAAGGGTSSPSSAGSSASSATSAAIKTAGDLAPYALEAFV